MDRMDRSDDFLVRGRGTSDYIEWKLRLFFFSLFFLVELKRRIPLSFVLASFHEPRRKSFDEPS